MICKTKAKMIEWLMILSLYQSSRYNVNIGSVMYLCLCGVVERSSPWKLPVIWGRFCTGDEREKQAKRVLFSQCQHPKIVLAFHTGKAQWEVNYTERKSITQWYFSMILLILCVKVFWHDKSRFVRKVAFAFGFFGLVHILWKRKQKLN